MSWKSTILRDSKVKTALRLAAKEKSWAEQTAELLSMHSGRQSRSLFTSKDFLKPTKISGAAMQDSAFRSRAVEILMEASVQSNILVRYIERLSDYIRTEYVSELKAFSTVSQRDGAVKSLLEVMYEQDTAIDNVMETARFIIDDIDKTSWSLSRAMDAISVVQSKGHEL